MADGLEIVFNCWYVFDDMGFIYSLRARAYVGVGSDKDKLRMLRSCAETDYLIAKPFPIPTDYKADFPGVKGLPVDLAVMPVQLLETQGGPVTVADLFHGAFKRLWSEIPSQTALRVPDSPLVCLTPLFADAAGNIRPRIDGAREL